MPFRKACLGRDQLPDCVSEAVNTAESRGRRCALLAINLCRFREVNVDFGFDTGDRVLVQLVERITGILKSGDKLFHIGNDEFVVLLENIKSPQVASLALGRILETLDKDFDISGQMLSLIAQGGAALYPDHVSRADMLLVAADAALMEARDRGKRYLLFDNALREGRRTHADLRAKLGEALEGNELQLYYQPQIKMCDGSVSGFEALARWQHDELGWVGPDQFIPVAESCGLIEKLTYWSFNVALRESAKLCLEGSSTTISINLSAKLLASKEVVDLLARAINIWGADPSRLVLEVTESAMMADPQAALDILLKIHAMGITLSIDDFGTGYSSLDYLKRLPVSELKIDKSFVLNMADDMQDRKIVQTIIDLAHNLDMHVVAEGVENQRVFDMLTGMGCEIGQGFHMARPMPVKPLSVWLNEIKQKNNAIA